MANWSLTSLQLKLIKIGARVVRHARAITFQPAKVTVTGPIVRARDRRQHFDLAGSAVMCLTLVPTGTERKRQDKSVRYAESRGHRTWIKRGRGLTAPVRALSQPRSTGRTTKNLINGPRSGQIAVKWYNTWGMQAK